MNTSVYSVEQIVDSLIEASLQGTATAIRKLSIVLAQCNLDDQKIYEQLHKTKQYRSIVAEIAGIVAEAYLEFHLTGSRVAMNKLAQLEVDDQELTAKIENSNDYRHLLSSIVSGMIGV